MAPGCPDAVGSGAGVAEGSRDCRARPWVPPALAEELVCLQGTQLLCRHSHGRNTPGAPWWDDKPEAAAEHGARCGATLCDAPAPPSWCQVLCGSRYTDAPFGLLKQRKGSPVCPGWPVTRGSCCQALWELRRGVGFNPSLSEQHSYCWCNSIHIYLYIHIYINLHMYIYNIDIYIYLNPFHSISTSNTCFLLFCLSTMYSITGLNNSGGRCKGSTPF